MKQSVRMNPDRTPDGEFCIWSLMAAFISDSHVSAIRLKCNQWKKRRSLPVEATPPAAETEGDRQRTH